MISDVRGLGAVAFLAAVVMASAAKGHDFLSPDSGRPTRVDYLERAAFSEPRGSPTRANLYQFWARKKQWSQDDNRLKVCFWNGDDAQKAEIADIADELTKGIPVKFIWKEKGRFLTCTPELKSTFAARVTLLSEPKLLAAGDDPTSFFAVVGQDGRMDGRLATVNLPFPIVSKKEFRKARILHEFCHVLGCLHEHQRGDCDATYNRTAIMQRKGLSSTDFAKNYLEIESSSMGAEAYGAFDSRSIMMYRTEPWMFLGTPPYSPCLRDTEVSELSPGDKAGLAYFYGDASGQLASLSISEFMSQRSALLQEASTKRSLAGLVEKRGATGILAKVAPNMAQSRFNSRLSTLRIEAAVLEERAKAYDFNPATLGLLYQAERESLSVPPTITVPPDGPVE